MARSKRAPVWPVVALLCAWPAYLLLEVVILQMLRLPEPVLFGVLAVVPLLMLVWHVWNLNRNSMAAARYRLNEDLDGKEVTRCHHDDT